MKDIFKVAAIFAVGFLVGSEAEHLWAKPQFKELYQQCDKFREDYNALTRETDQLRLDLINCKALNRQVGTYAMQLKKNLDNFME